MKFCHQQCKRTVNITKNKQKEDGTENSTEKTLSLKSGLNIK